MNFWGIVLSLVFWGAGLAQIPVDRQELRRLAEETRQDTEALEHALGVKATSRLLFPATPTVPSTAEIRLISGLRFGQLGVLPDLRAQTFRRLERLKAIGALGGDAGWAARWRDQKEYRGRRTGVTRSVLIAERRADAADTPENLWRRLLKENKKLLERLKNLP